MIAAIAKVLFFLIDRSDHNDRSDHIAYFKCKDCLQRNLYLKCVSLLKSLKALVRLNKCSSLVKCVDFSDLSGATVGCL